MSDIFAKTKSTFGDLAVDKRIATHHELARLPRFVVEYLVAEFTESCGGTFDEKCADKLNRFVAQYYYESREKDAVLHTLMTTGFMRLIDEIKVDTNIKQGIHKAHLPSLNIRDAMINRTLVDEYQNLLTTGMWGLANLVYAPDSVPTDSTGNPLTSPVLIEGFVPFQATKIDTKIFKEAREKFTLEEWIDLLMNTIGINPLRYRMRQKLVMLSRLIPLIETNVNMMEFGPRATGKTFLYRNTTYYTRIFSGGNISPAVLFYNIAMRVLGEIGIRDTVIFDEISKVKFTNPSDMLGKLKDYLESGNFERGPKKRIQHIFFGLNG
jgi:ATP-dependent Lon protease